MQAAQSRRRRERGAVGLEYGAVIAIAALVEMCIRDSLVTGHPALVDQLGEVAGVLEVLLHDVGDVVVVPDVEDPHEDGMAERPGAARGRRGAVAGRDGALRPFLFR